MPPGAIDAWTVAGSRPGRGLLTMLGTFALASEGIGDRGPGIKSF